MCGTLADPTAFQLKHMFGPLPAMRMPSLHNWLTIQESYGLDLLKNFNQTIRIMIFLAVVMVALIAQVRGGRRHKVDTVLEGLGQSILNN